MLKKLLLATVILSTQAFAEVKDPNVSILRETIEIINVFKQCSRMTPSFITSYSRLDEKLVEKIEMMLPAALKTMASDKTINLDDYYRQYVSFGHLRREGVYINAIHKAAARKWAANDPARKQLLENWQSKSISICGGEGLHWGAIYDGSGDVISEIQFNMPEKSKK